jgi:hypothetical protein
LFFGCFVELLAEFKTTTPIGYFFIAEAIYAIYKLPAIACINNVGMTVVKDGKIFPVCIDSFVGFDSVPYASNQNQQSNSSSSK